MHRIRLREARVLLADHYYDGAHYLAGYAVECALKACIAGKTRRYEFPDKQKAVRSHTHDLEELLRLAELESELRGEVRADPEFADNWSVVKDWSEQSRYARNGKRVAEDLYYAVAGRRHGVLRWIRQRW